jgi:hypothetical protein
MLQFRDSVLACTRVDRDSVQKIGARVQMVEKAEVCGVYCCESATPAGKNLSSRWFTHYLHCQCGQEGGILHMDGMPTGECRLRPAVGQ